MNIVTVSQDNFDEWLELALQLWPDCSAEEMRDILQNILQSNRETGFLVRDEDETAIAFMNLSLRYEYVAGATKRPVAYIEGIYVKDTHRKQGIGAALIQHAEQWALAQECIELASDALLENTGSYGFHTSMGFQEVERTVSFIKPLNFLN